MFDLVGGYQPTVFSPGLRADSSEWFNVTGKGEAGTY